VGIWTIVWALDAVGLDSPIINTSVDWVYAVLNWLKELGIKIIELEFINKPLTATQNVLAALSADRRFDTDNEGFIIMFIWFVYPIIWNFSLPSAIFNVLILPLYITLFLLESELFIDVEASKLAGYNVPQEGIPTSFAKAYNI